MAQFRLPRYLETRDADVSVRSLFVEGRVDTVEELRAWAASRRTILVGLDVEGSEGHGHGVNSIGTATVELPGAAPSPSPPPCERPADLADLVRRHRIGADVLVCAPRRERARFERFPFGGVRRVGKAGVERDLVGRLQALRARPAELVLVVWQWQTEFKAMGALFPGAARCFGRWIDLCEDVRRMANARRSPSLRDAMLSMGFTRASVQSRNRDRHSPGMDAARVIGVLMELWSKPASWRVEFGGMFKREEREHRTMWSVRPPSSVFPHMVHMAVQVNDGTGNHFTFLPEKMRFGERLFVFLKENIATPQAVAVCLRTVPGTSTKKGKVAYVCLASKAMVARLLKWDGREIDGKTLVLTDVSVATGPQLVTERSDGGQQTSTPTCSTPKSIQRGYQEKAHNNRK